MKNTNMTPAVALKLAKQKQQDKTAKELGVIVTGNGYESSLLCHAASHVGLKILGIKNGENLRSVTKQDLELSKADWQAHINRASTWQLQTPKITHTEIKPSVSSELDDLIGLTEVKSQVRDVVAFMQIRAKREQAGLPSIPMGQHLVFTGNPGTGKTTVARLIGDIYRDIGVLPKGQFIETDGRGLIADYLGQTAGKVREVVEQAIGGVLFIDEAYALTPSEHQVDYCHEAIATLIKLMEDHRDELVVILAGYDKEMAELLKSNPGLKSRFKTQIQFSDYSPGELHQIFEKLCADHGYQLVPRAAKAAKKLCATMHAQKQEHFGNGRAVRNLFERCLINQARRLSGQKQPSKQDLQQLLARDIPAHSELTW